MMIFPKDRWKQKYFQCFLQSTTICILWRSVWTAQSKLRLIIVQPMTLVWWRPVQVSGPKNVRKKTHALVTSHSAYQARICWKCLKRRGSIFHYPYALPTFFVEFLVCQIICQITGNDFAFEYGMGTIGGWGTKFDRNSVKANLHKKLGAARAQQCTTNGKRVK